MSDQATLSNYTHVRNLHTHLEWTINWADQLIAGSATLTLRPETEEPVKKVVLDTSFLDVKSVKVEGREVKWEKAERIEAMGEALTIYLEEPMSEEVSLEELRFRLYCVLIVRRSSKSPSSTLRPRNARHSGG
jgi:leukotriene-A4 hydrolase